MTSIDVIILSYAHNEQLRALTIQALESLFSSEDPNEIQFQAIVIESNKNTPPYEFRNTETVYPDQKFGYHKYMNIGITLGVSSYVCICNNDLLFYKNWSSEILKAFKKYPELKSASPLCTIQHPEKGFYPNTGDYFGYSIRKEISGWCLLFRRDILKTIGKLDEKFRFWYADDDYAQTLKKFGLQHALITSSLVDHLESRTLSQSSENAQQRLTLRERFYYEYKWGNRSYLSYLFRLYKFQREEWRRRKKG